MNFGLRKMQISSAAVPPNRIRPIQRRPGAGVRRALGALPAPSRERLGDALEADPARALHEHRVARAQQRRQQLGGRRGVGDRVASPANASAISAASGPTATSSSTPLRARVLADLAVQRAPPRARARACRRAPPRAAPAAVSGEVVDRGAHGHRVGVVAVVDQDHARRAARARWPRIAENAHLQPARWACTPSAARRPRRRAGCAGCAPGRSDGSQLDRARPSCVDQRPRRRRDRARSSATSAALAERDRVARRARRCGSSSGSPAGTTTRRAGARGRRSAPPWRRRSPPASRAARDAPGRR